MYTVKGLYQDGKIVLQQDVRYATAIQVLVIFLDDLESVETKQQQQQRKQRKPFSFRQARELLNTYTGSLSDAVLEERRQEL